MGMRWTLFRKGIRQGFAEGGYASGICQTRVVVRGAIPAHGKTAGYLCPNELGADRNES